MKTLTTEPQDIVRELIERGINQNDMDAVDELVHSDYRYLTPTEDLHGREQLKQLIATYREVFPDLQIVIDHQFAAGNQVCTRLVLRGKHLGSFNGAPPTGRRIEAQGVVISRVAEGRILDEWELIDELSIARQLGQN